MARERIVCAGVWESVRWVGRRERRSGSVREVFVSLSGSVRVRDPCVGRGRSGIMSVVAMVSLRVAQGASPSSLRPRPCRME